MNRRKRRIVIALLLLLLVIGPPVWITYREYRQARLDHALIEAIKAGDDQKALEALAEGASGEARDTGEPPTFQRALLQLLNHFRHHTNSVRDGEHLPALLLYQTIYRPPQSIIGRGSPGSIAQAEASVFPNVTVCRALLDHGAKANDQDSYGLTPLFHALIFSNSNGDTVKMLLEHGANIEAMDKSKTTPLMYAARNGKADIVRILLQHGANVEAQNSDGRTALLNIVCTEEGRSNNRGETAIVRLLLEHGAKVGTKDNYGMTALDEVKPFPDSRKIEALLHQYGAK